MPSPEHIADMKRVEAMERARSQTVERILTATIHGDHRPLYRNMATGRASTPVLSPMEIKYEKELSDG